MKKETFEAHGYTWFKHIPGEPMPCKNTDKVRVLLRNEDYLVGIFEAGEMGWGSIGSDGVYDEHDEIIGWYPAEQEK